MCVITKKDNNEVISVSLIPGINLNENMLLYYNIYFPVSGHIPSVGDIYIGNENCLIS